MRSGLALAMLATLSIAIGCSHPPLPTQPSPPTPTPAGQQACSFAALTQSAQVFTFDSAPATVASWTRCSRFVLHDSGRFELQYGESGSYPGTYRISGNAVEFTWDGWSAAGPWESTATLEGDILTVKYNFIMQMTDFEDAVYRRAS